MHVHECCWFRWYRPKRSCFRYISYLNCRFSIVIRTECNPQAINMMNYRCIAIVRRVAQYECTYTKAHTNTHNNKKKWINQKRQENWLVDVVKLAMTQECVCGKHTYRSAPSNYHPPRVMLVHSTLYSPPTFKQRNRFRSPGDFLVSR